MTPTQEKIFAQVNSLLEEHFEGAVVSVVYSDEKGMQWTRHWYTGGRIQAIGLTRVVEANMLQEQINQPEEL